MKPASAPGGGALPTVLLTGPMHPDGVALLQPHARVVLAPDAAPDTLRRGIAEADALVVRSPLPADCFDHAPRLRGVVRQGVGVDMIPVEAATARGLPVANVPGSNRDAVAEYAVTAMAALARRLPGMDRRLRAGEWDAARALAEGARELAGRRVGIVGVGSIGARIAEICHHGYRMQVAGHQRRLDALPPFVLPRTLDELAAESDFLVLACPLNAATRGLLSEARLALMPHDAILVNVARGALVDEDALHAALAGRRIGGAVLDVYRDQPLAAGHRWAAFEQVLLTPHAAGLTDDSMRRMSLGAAEEVLRLLRGEPMRHVVNGVNGVAAARGASASR